VNEEKLFNEFPPVSTQDWEAVIQADLKGADYEKKLVWKTIEGFKVKPYYRAEDLQNLKYLNVNPAEFPYVRGSQTEGNKWEIRQDITVEKPEEAGKIAIDALEKGATAVGFITGEAVKSAADFAKLLAKYPYECASVNFIAGSKSLQILGWLADDVAKRGVATADVKGSIDIDPLGHLTATGNWYASEEADFAELKNAIELAKAKLPKFKVIGVDASLFINAGSNISQEMGFALAIGNEYLARLTAAGLNADDVAKRIQFNFSTSSNYFFEIAKYRAFRMLWAKVVETYKPACSCTPKAYIHATTCDFNKTVFDPNVNMLRVTTEAMSAVLGGANSLTIKGFDFLYKKENDFSDRIARNVQVLLKEEAYFEKIVDPAAGSYYIENLTNSLAEQAWTLFQKVEAEGGYTEALKKGLVQSEVEAIANQRLKNIATRRETVLGTNQFPNFKETVLANIDTSVYDKKEKASANQAVKPIVKFRAADEFETLRLRTERSGKRPKVFMLTIGNLAMRLARSQFSSNFFACAGFEIIDNNGFKTSEEGAKAAFEAKADIVVICSSDDEYAVFAPEVAELLGNKAIFVVAGAPACQAELEAKGIKNFISVKSNVLDTLKAYQTELKIS
jgi:methylmalonyl-CoA mutase